MPVLCIRRDFGISCVCDAPMTGVRNDLDILIQSTLTNFKRGCNPGRASFFQFFWGNTQLDHIFDSVNSNGVAILDQRDRTANLGLGDDMANTKSVRTVAGFFNFRREIRKNRGKKDQKWYDDKKVDTHPPLNRPSVRHATSRPRPAPIIKLVGLSISGMPSKKKVKVSWMP